MQNKSTGLGAPGGGVSGQRRPRNHPLCVRQLQGGTGGNWGVGGWLHSDGVVRGGEFGLSLPVSDSKSTAGSRRNAPDSCWSLQAGIALADCGR